MSCFSYFETVHPCGNMHHEMAFVRACLSLSIDRDLGVAWLHVVVEVAANEHVASHGDSRLRVWGMTGNGLPLGADGAGKQHQQNCRHRATRDRSHGRFFRGAYVQRHRGLSKTRAIPIQYAA